MCVLEFETAGQLGGGMKKTAEPACQRAKTAGQTVQVRRWFGFDNSFSR